MLTSPDRCLFISGMLFISTPPFFEDVLILVPALLDLKQPIDMQIALKYVTNFAHYLPFATMLGHVNWRGLALSGASSETWGRGQ